LSLAISGIIIVCCVAFFTGVSRTGIPGVGILLIPLIAMAMPVRASTGFLLPILVEADLMAVLYWKRSVVWPHLFRVLPWTALGVVIGYFLMGVLDERLFKPILGAMIVGIVALDLLRRWARIEIVPENRILSAIVGVLAGAFTMVANAAGPIMTIYLLSMELPKEEFVGTGAIFYCIINLFKVPFSVALGLITWNTLRIDLMLIPLIAIGCLAGIRFMRKLPQQLFNQIALVLAALGGLKMLF
jgi:uncharacterized protein